MLDVANIPARMCGQDDVYSAQASARRILRQPPPQFNPAQAEEGETADEHRDELAERQAGALGTRKDDCLVQCFDVARPNDFYHWWTFPVADFLGIAEPLFQDRGSARREARKRGLEGAFVPEDEVCPYVD